MDKDYTKHFLHVPLQIHVISSKYKVNIISFSV